MRITLDSTKCTALGICESLAPDLFEVDDNGDLVVKQTVVGEEHRDALETAVAGCPTAALSIEEG